MSTLTMNFMNRVKKSEFYLLDKFAKLCLDICDYHMIDNDYLDIKSLKKIVFTRIGLSVLSIKDQHKSWFENGRNMKLDENHDLHSIDIFI